ncbi:MAG: hypothetical protein ACO2Z5_01705 [Burkholderiaceae bacterium]|jgi:hypothetical protein
MSQYEPYQIKDPRDTPSAAQAAMSIIWPSFLAAAALSGVVFSVIDPQDVPLFAEQLEIGRREAYGLGFLVFWACAALASAMTYLLARPPST